MHVKLVNSLKVLGVLFLFFMLSGCKEVKPTKTGFLHDYSMLKEVPDNPAALFFEEKCVLWERYHKVIVDPVEIYFTDEGKKRKLKNKEVQRMADYFREAMIEAIGKRYHIVTEPSPDTLRVTTAVVDVKPVDVIANLISKSLFYLPIDLGEAAIEGELSGSLTGERFAAIVDHKIGSMFSILGTYTTWGHAKGMLDDWAEQLATMLDQTMKQKIRKIQALHIEADKTNHAVIKFEMNQLSAAPNGFVTDSPPMITLDFDKTRSGMSTKIIQMDVGPINNIAVIEDGCKTRVVIKTGQAMAHVGKVEGFNYVIELNPVDDQKKGKPLWAEFHSQ